MRLHPASLLALAAIGSMTLVACGDDTASGSGGSATDGAGSGGENGSGTRDASGTGGQGSTTDAAATTTGSGGGAPVEDPLAQAPLATGVRLDRVVAMQTTSVPLVEGGVAAPSGVPLVAGRDAWLRAFLTVDGATARIRFEVLVQATPGAPVQVFQSSEVTPVDGVDDDVATTAICPVPAAALVPGATWTARVVADGAAEVAAGTPSDARFPRDGSLVALGAQVAEPLRITLVPFRWDGDGTGRLPDTSPPALDAIRALFVARFPVAEVELTLHEVVPWDVGYLDFDDVNDFLYDQRESEAPPPDTYWYGMLAPADSFDDYCNGTCTTGQSFVADYADEDYLRVGAGVAFNPEDGAATMVHEIGHQFGRYHAPCDVTYSDEDYPYEDGVLGVMGWDPRDATPLDAFATTDFMGYCDPQGTSDYTFGALFARHLAVASLASVAPAARLAPRGAARPAPITCSHAR